MILKDLGRVYINYKNLNECITNISWMIFLKAHSTDRPNFTSKDAVLNMGVRA